MATISGAQLLVKALKQEGIDRIFSLCGDHLNAVYHACLEQGIRIVDVRHESAAAHMADGWARVTGRPGVCAVTGGPGHTNAITGVATAFLAGSPVIFLSGAFETIGADRYTFQELDQIGLARPITKWARLVTDPKRIPEYTATAFREAMAGRPGPVHLSLPVDVLLKRVEEEGITFSSPERYRPESRPQGEPRLIEQAFELLRRAERPVLIAGSGTFWAKASEELQRFIERTKIPLFTVDLARGIVSDLHPFCFGYADPFLSKTAQVAFQEADVVLLIGKRFDFRLGFGGPKVFNPHAKVIQIDITQQELGRNRGVELGVLADARAALEQLLAITRTPWQEKPWVRHLRTIRQEWRESLKPYEESEATPIHPLRLCREVKEFLTEEAIIAIDGGDFLQWPRMVLPARRPGHWLRLGSLGTVGAALPLALAAKLAKPEAPVVLFIGDGGMGFYGYEFHTAVRHNLPIVAIVGNDQGWGMERQIQAAIYGEDKTVGVELGLLRYDRIVEAMGGHGEFVEKPEELRPALERAFASGLPACVNVMIQPVKSPLCEASIAKYRNL